MEEQCSRERVLHHNNGSLTQALIEGEVALPVGKPEMERVLMVRGHAQTAQVELLEGRVMTDGTVTLCVCYVCAEGKVHAIESVSTFKHTADLPGAQPGMRGMAQAYVCEVNYEMIDSRRLNVSAVVDVQCEMEEEKDLCALEKEHVPEGVVTKTKHLPLRRRCARGTAAVEVVGDIELPTGAPLATQVLCCQGHAEILQAFCQEDAIGVEGALKLNIVVGTEDEQTPILQCFPQLPFSQMIAAPGARMDQQAMVRAQWKDLFARVNEEGDSLHIEAVCTLEADTSAERTMTVVTDAYALGHDVVLEEEQVSVCVAIAKAKGQVPVREQVSVPLEEQPSKVLSCFANACAARATAEQDKICIDTVVQCDVLFLDRSEELQSIRCEIPVHLEEEAPCMTACMQVFAHVVCEQIQAVTNGDGLDIRVMLAWEAEGEQEQEITLVCGIELEEESEKRPAGIIIYFVGMGEDLWDVAKRYRVRMEDIRYKGKEENKPVEKGDKLILICR